MKRSLFRPFLFPLFSPPGFLLLGGFFIICYWVADLLGADACLTLLAGGRPESDISTDVALAAAGFFLVLHFFVWLVTPALVIGAGLFWGAARLAGRRHPPVLSAPPEEEESVS